jgi:hypothetical protein
VVVLHVLGEISDRRAFGPVMAVLALPPDQVDGLLGDAITESLGNILISLTGAEDADALEAALADTGIEPFTRDAIFLAWTRLALTGAIPRERAEAFLTEYPTRVGLDVADFGWSSWVDAVTRLGFADMAGYAREHLAARLTDPAFLRLADVTVEDFERQLAETLSDPDGQKDTPRLQPFTDTIAELSTWYGYSEKGRAERARYEAESKSIGERSFLDDPFIAENVYRDVGRNDPCPCGSGKKFKKCCLAA